MTAANHHSTVLHRHSASRKAPRALVRTDDFVRYEPRSDLHILAVGVLAMGSGFGFALLLHPLLPF
jgi:hypothetical protein